MKNLALFLTLMVSGACVSVQKEGTKEDLIEEGSPFAGNWISRGYADLVSSSKSPYKASLESPYQHLIIRAKGKDSLLIKQISYEDSEDAPLKLFIKEGAIFNQIGMYPIGCDTCALAPCAGKDCQILKVQQNGDNILTVLNNEEFIRIPDLCTNPDDQWWLCMDYWVNSLVIVGDYEMINLSDQSRKEVSLLANNQLIGLENHSTYSLWNWFLQEQSAYKFDVLQLNTDDYSEDQFDFTKAYAVEKSGDTLKLFSTQVNHEKWLAEKVKMEFLLIKK